MDIFTLDQDQYLITNYLSSSARKMGLVLNRSAPAIRQRLKKLGLRKRHNQPPWSDEEDQKLAMLYRQHQLSVKEIADALNRSVNSVRLRGNRKFAIFRSDAHLRTTFSSANFYHSLKQAIRHGTAKAKCCLCSYDKHVDLHHCDGNRDHNDFSNISSLCPNHHREVEAGEHPNTPLFLVWWRVYTDGTRSAMINNIDERKYADRAA